MEFRLARKDDMLDIAYMLCICFNESMDSVKFYLDNKFKLDRCTVCVIDDRVVSSLSMLETDIYINRKQEKANYIYAAATLPQYRSKGCMGKLIKYSCDMALKRQEKYSTLLPAKSDLYGYYERFGYESFFKIKFVKISNQEMKNCIFENNEQDVYNLLKEKTDLYKLINNICKNINGSIIWSEESINYSISSNYHYGGNTLYVSNGYAICFVDNKNCVHVIEFMCEKGSIKKLLQEIYKSYPEMDYKFRVPVDTDILNFKGEVKPFGMIKKLSDNDNGLDDCKYPYLGLPLD